MAAEESEELSPADKENFETLLRFGSFAEAAKKTHNSDYAIRESAAKALNLLLSQARIWQSPHAKLVELQQNKGAKVPDPFAPPFAPGNSEVGSASFIPSEPGDTLGVLKAVIRKGSAAYKKGVRTGDYLIAVNGIPIKDLCTYILMERKDEEALFKFLTPNGMEKTVRLKRTN